MVLYLSIDEWSIVQGVRNKVEFGYNLFYVLLPFLIYHLSL